MRDKFLTGGTKHSYLLITVRQAKPIITEKSKHTIYNTYNMYIFSTMLLHKNLETKVQIKRQWYLLCALFSSRRRHRNA